MNKNNEEVTTAIEAQVPGYLCRHMCTGKSKAENDIAHKVWVEELEDKYGMKLEAKPHIMSNHDA